MLNWPKESPTPTLSDGVKYPDFVSGMGIDVGSSEHANSKTQSPVYGQAKPLDGPVILLVEDDPAVRKMLKRFLHMNGFQVIEASDGAEGFSRWQANADGIRVVLSDVVMPVCDGVEMIRRIREQPRPTFLGFILISGFADQVIQRHGLLPEGVELVYKPVHPSELLTKIKALILDKS